jgi:hypothetical protein
MKALHRSLVEIAAASLDGFEPRPESPERIALAEERLGGPLPRGYRAFLEEIGSVSWPLSIGNVIDFERGPFPDFFVPFADDLGGNYHGFDLRARKGRELAIDFWDHEEPELDEEPAVVGTFDDWLAGVVGDVIRAREEERKARIAQQIGPHVVTSFAPSREQVAEVEAALGASLPLDYVWFTTSIGSTPWPVRIADALELEAKAEAFRRKFPRAPRRAIAFAEEPGGGWAAFDKGGVVRGFGVARPAPPAFLDYLEDRMSHAPDVVPSKSSEDPEIDLALSLIHRLREEDLLETTRGFDPAAVAPAIADAWPRPSRIVDILMDRADVVEVYASEDDVAAIVAELSKRS